MNTIMFVLLGLLAVAVGIVAWIFFRQRIIFMMGIRNIPRRTAQTVLIIIGLMLSTLIITAAFTTGDTVDYSITKQAYDLLGHADIVLDGGKGGACPANHIYMINSEYLKFRPSKNRNMTPLEKVQSINQDATVQLITWAGNMTTSNSSLSGVLHA